MRQWCATSNQRTSVERETKHATKYVTEANSLHCIVKEKAEEVKTVELQLDELLLQLWNN